MTATESSTLIVPCEPNDHTAQQNFMLTPSASQRWVTQLIQNNEAVPGTQDIFNITFTNNAKNPSIAKRQEAILVINIEDPDWEFFGNGVEYVTSESNCNYNISSVLSDDNRQLTITVQQVSFTYKYVSQSNPPADQVIEVQPSTEPQPLNIDFRYTAKQVSTGKYYMSQDPRVVVDRPKED
ncbi:hypothetical protein [Pseudoalteromonas pernae]|uniref:hypothetical protein n=1 Tax=Pseudoalteromonas pernae TaxID=3118054 RepID=UPI003241CC79